MRVIGGSARGRKLKPPPGRFIRPTADRVREALFNLIGPFGSAGRVLDLFSGTGALAVEALSRGAELAVLVEKDRRAIALIEHNLELCSFSSRARVERSSAQRFLQAGPSIAFDLVLLDPPYDKGLVAVCLDKLGHADWLAPGGRVFAETESGLSLESSYGNLEIGRTKRYGDTAIVEFVSIDTAIDRRPAMG